MMNEGAQNVDNTFLADGVSVSIRHVNGIVKYIYISLRDTCFHSVYATDIYCKFKKEMNQPLQGRSSVWSFKTKTCAMHSGCSSLWQQPGNFLELNSQESAGHKHITHLLTPIK